MTAERVWIDARGGGFGHAMRGANLAALLAEEGHRVTLCVRPGSETFVESSPWFELRVHEGIPTDRGGTLVVDTFAEGARGEWNACALQRFSRRVLCARYRKDGLRAEGYDEVWLPYAAAHDEWQNGHVQNARYLGLLARPAPRIEPRGAWVVFDPGARLDPELHAVFTRLARALGLSLEVVRALPRRAAKLLCIGAGYNTVYELLRQPLDVRFLPLSRRYDDQARRARLLDRATCDLEALRAWLRAPCSPSALPDAWYAQTLRAERGAA